MELLEVWKLNTVIKETGWMMARGPSTSRNYAYPIVSMKLHHMVPAIGMMYYKKDLP